MITPVANSVCWWCHAARRFVSQLRRKAYWSWVLLVLMAFSTHAMVRRLMSFCMVFLSWVVGVVGEENRCC